MRIVFFGATQAGYKCCSRLIENGHNVVGIFTIPKKFKISYSKDKPVNNMLFADFFQLGKKNNIPVVLLEDKMSTYIGQIEKMNPDFILVLGWYYLIPKSILSIPPKGCAGIHGSLLPKYRGNAPLVWAMINGEKETGVTLLYFDEGVDTGDIIAQKKFSIEDEDTIGDLLEKLEKATIEIVDEMIPLISEDKAPRIPQDSKQATVFPARSPEDGLIDWSWDAQRIKNFIRAQTKPYPGAFTFIGDKKVIIWDADILERDIGSAGR